MLGQPGLRRLIQEDLYLHVYATYFGRREGQLRS